MTVSESLSIANRGGSEGGQGDSKEYCDRDRCRRVGAVDLPTMLSSVLGLISFKRGEGPMAFLLIVLILDCGCRVDFCCRIFEFCEGTINGGLVDSRDDDDDVDEDNDVEFTAARRDSDESSLRG